MRGVLIAALFLLGSPRFPAFSQGRPDPDQAVEAMRRVAFLEGAWSGEGWSQMGGGPKDEFTVKEIVEAKLDGAMLLIEGIGHSKVDQSKGHHALAVIAYDPDEKQLVFSSFVAGRPRQDLVLEVGPTSLVRKFSVPDRGQVRYTIDVAEGVWMEKGEFSTDGDTWRTFLEMRLEKE